MRSRREVLRLGLAATTTLSTTMTMIMTAGCSTGGYGGPSRRLRIAAGDPGGLYVEFADLLATQLAEVEPELDATVVNTGGSRQNLEMVHSGEVDLGLTLADTATAAVAGEPPFTAALPLRALGRVYENYMQLVVPVDSPIATVRDLGGARISLGADGSGAAVFGDRLLAATGVRARVVHRPLTAATGDLAAGRLDAMLWSGGVPTPALSRLDAVRPIRLVSMSAGFRTLRDTYGAVYKEVTVPDGGYGHPRPVTTIGVSNLLVAGPGLPDDVAAAVVRVLVRRAPRLVPEQALGTQYLDQPSLITTGDVRMHPGAARAYRGLRD